MFFFASVIRKNRITAIHAHFATAATLTAEMISRLEKIPYSFCAHAYDIFKHDVDRSDLRRKIRNARFVRTVSRFHKNFLLAIDPTIPTDKIKIISYGVDVSQFRPEKPTRHSRFLILSVGNLVAKKGFPVLIDACHILKKDGIEFECWIVGAGPLHSQLERRIERHQLIGDVILRGAVAHQAMNELYNAADVFVLPAVRTEDGDMDGIPNVLIEAMAAESPVISTYLSGIQELIDHEINGLLVPSEKASPLAEAMERIYKEPDFAAVLATNGRMKVLANYRAEDVAERLLKLF
jgi:glycosyltransferase involved in cell wall biosynthesis